MGENRNTDVAEEHNDLASAHRAARSMKVVFDKDGKPWICDASVDESKDLKEQGCWRYGEKTSSRNE